MAITGSGSPHTHALADIASTSDSRASQILDYQKPEQGSPKTSVDFLLGAYNERGLSNFFVPGGAERAAAALANAKNIVLLTGFNVAEGMPETDGPPGLAALAHALKQTGKTVTIVTDSLNKPAVQEALRVLNPHAAQFSRFITFDEKDGPEAIEKANRILDTYNIDAVVAVELTGRNSEGIRRNMRGVNINDFNAATDEVLVAANNKEGITTIAVGDGGNEAGMGGLDGIPPAIDGSEMASVVPAHHQVTSWNSNLGAEMVAAGVLAKHAALNKLHTPGQQTEMIETIMVKAGAADGVTRGKIPGEESIDAKGRPVWSGVDGFHPEVHRGVLRMVRNVASQISQTHHITDRTEEGPFLIGAFDSSNGGLIAAKNLAAYIQERSTHNARLIIVTDHGNAPYGEKSRDALVMLVGDGLKTAEMAGVDVVAMACNTACTAFPDAKNDINVPVIDLIGVTAQKIVELGGDKPVLLSTEATAKAPDYPNRVRDASNGRVKLHALIGAKSWAPLINYMRHKSTEPTDIAYVKEQVARYVDQVPSDASSVWLCCTHYPALKPHIEERLSELGLGHIKVIDPMEHQAEAIIATLDQGGKSIDRSARSKDLRPIVLTTGDKAMVSQSVGVLLNTNDAIVVKTPFKEFNIEMLNAAVEKADATAARRASWGLLPTYSPSHAHPLQQQLRSESSGASSSRASSEARPRPEQAQLDSVLKLFDRFRMAEPA